MSKLIKKIILTFNKRKSENLKPSSKTDVKQIRSIKTHVDKALEPIKNTIVALLEKVIDKPYYRKVMRKCFEKKGSICQLIIKDKGKLDSIIELLSTLGIKTLTPRSEPTFTYQQTKVKIMQILKNTPGIDF